ITFSQNNPGMQGSRSAQSGIALSGQLIDNQTKQTIEYGNVILFSVRDSSMAAGTISDSEGRFLLNNIKPGMYYLRASFMGYSDLMIATIRLKPLTKQVDLGILYLDESSIEIGNVVVTGERDMIINNPDKKV